MPLESRPDGKEFQAGSGDLRGPFSASVSSGNKHLIESKSPPSQFELVMQAVQWCVKERERLLALHPRRRWTGAIQNRDGCLHQLAFCQH